MLKKDFVVRSYQPGDEKEIVKLLDLVFGGWPKFDLNQTSLDHWKWKYLHNPLKKSYVSVALNNGTIIGCSHGAYLKVNVMKKSLLCRQGMDLAVHSDFRRIGVNTKMTEKNREIRGKENVDLTYNVTGNPILIKRAIKRRRPRFPSPVLHMMRISDFELHLVKKNIVNPWLKKLGFNILKIKNRILNKFSRTISSSLDEKKFNIMEINSFDERIDEFWGRVREHYDFIVEAKKDYLNWRYCDPRGGNYVTKIAEENGKILGYIVMRINRYNRDYPEGYIVDILTYPDREEVAINLIKHAVYYFEEKEINIIHTWIVKSHKYEKLLQKFGFVNARAQFRVSCRYVKAGFDQDELDKTSGQHLHFTYGYTDWI